MRGFTRLAAIASQCRAKARKEKTMSEKHPDKLAAMPEFKVLEGWQVVDVLSPGDDWWAVSFEGSTLAFFPEQTGAMQYREFLVNSRLRKLDTQ